MKFSFFCRKLIIACKTGCSANLLSARVCRFWKFLRLVFWKNLLFVKQVTDAVAFDLFRSSHAERYAPALSVDFFYPYFYLLVYFYNG